MDRAWRQRTTSTGGNGSSVEGGKMRILFTCAFVFCTIISVWRCIYVVSERKRVSFSPVVSWASTVAEKGFSKVGEDTKIGSNHQHVTSDTTVPNTAPITKEETPGKAQPTTSATKAPQTIDAWVAAILRPNPPRPLSSALPHSYPRIRWGKYFAHYKMHGINYEMSSRSTRLQRLPMLEGFVSQIENPAVGRRFPSNPALARHPIRHRQDGPDSANYALAIQLGSGSFTRNPDSMVKYSQDRGHWRVSTVWLNITVIQFGPDDYALSYSGTSEKVDSILGQDMRLTEYEGFDNTDSQPSTLLGWGSNQLKAMDALRLTDAATPKGDHLPMPMLVEINGKSSPQKNWVPILDDAPDGAPLWIIHYSPFVVVDCGRLPKPGSSGRRVNCRPHRPEMDQSDTQAFKQYSAKCLASLPSGSEHWRGSAPLVRLPWNRRLALGTAHQRGYTKDGLFYDAYRYRFVLVDLDSTSLIAYTDEFAIFSSIDDINWFEFLTGCTLYKDKEVLLSFGYNDQEPWLAILPLRGILQWLIPVEPKWESLVDQARAGVWQ